MPAFRTGPEAQCHLVLVVDLGNQLISKVVPNVAVEVGSFGSGIQQLLEAFDWYIEEMVKSTIAELQLQEAAFRKVFGRSEQCGRNRLAMHSAGHRDHFSGNI